MRLDCRADRSPVWALGLCVVGVALGLGTARALAAEPVELEGVTVQGEGTAETGVGQTQRVLDRRDLAGVPRAGGTDSFRALGDLPGVLAQGADPFGLAGTELGIRGVSGGFVGLSLEGIPLYGIMPIGPRTSSFDLENLERVALASQGKALPAGAGNRGGSVTMRLQRPSERPAARGVQRFGSEAYTKTFLRLDSGPLTRGGPTVFASGSIADGDQWRGPGTLGPRRVGSLGVAQAIGREGELFAFFNYHEHESDTFRRLSFEQARDLDTFGDLGFNAALTGDPAQDVNFFRYHQRDRRTRDGFLQLRWGPPERQVTGTPYVSWDDASLKEGGRTRLRDLFRYGAQIEGVFGFGNHRLDWRLWYERTDFEKYVARYPITPEGERRFAGWAFLADSDGVGQFLRPGVQYSGGAERLGWSLGVRYAYYEEPPSTAFQPGSDPSPDPETAIAESPGEDSAASVGRKRFDAVLPSAGLTFELQPGLQLRAHYRRQDQRPYRFVPLAIAFARNRMAFLDAGLNLDDVFDAYRLEIADSLEFGLSAEGSNGTLGVTGFWTHTNDLLVTAEDPRVGVDYLQNVGAARTLGVELAGTRQLAPTVSVTASTTYTDAQFTNTVNALDRQGNTVPNVPDWQAKAAVAWTPGGWAVTPKIAYVGERFGDVANDERIGGHAVVDLNLAYERPRLGRLRRVRLTASVLNLLDRQYIGAIETGNDSLSGDYLPGPERALQVSLDARL